MKNLVIWGADREVAAFLKRRPDLQPEYLISLDKRQHGKKLGKYLIRYPSRREIYVGKRIIVGSAGYEETAKRLQQEGLLEGRDFVPSRSMEQSKRLNDFDFEAAMRKSLGWIAQRKKDYFAKPILLARWTNPASVLANLPYFFKRWGEFRDGGQMILAQELSDFITPNIEGFYSLLPIHLPFFFDWDYFPRSYNYYLSGMEFAKGKAFCWSEDSYAETCDLVAKDDILASAAQNIRGKSPTMAEGYEFYVARYVYEYFNELLQMIQPSKIYLWNEFVATHRIAKYSADQCGVKTAYMEFGNLPGTFQMDEKGQMGESWPALRSREFLSLHVSEKDIEEARQMCRMLSFTEENRRKQPANDMWQTLWKRIDLSRPILLYAGQNDYNAGMYPYDDRARMFHSPIFQSSDEAASFLAGVCEKNNWNLIYKLHPMIWKQLKESGRKPECSGNVILLPQGDINKIIDWCDAVVTILSTASYVALVRKKPVVMLGYTQLKDKGCTYQAFDRDSVESALKAALSGGFTAAQQCAFYQHVAQLRKYYLYDDGKDKKMPCGQCL